MRKTSRRNYTFRETFKRIFRNHSMKLFRVRLFLRFTFCKEFGAHTQSVLRTCRILGKESITLSLLWMQIVFILSIHVPSHSQQFCESKTKKIASSLRKFERAEKYGNEILTGREKWLHKIFCLYKD